jgi:hypothetical protein
MGTLRLPLVMAVVGLGLIVLSGSGATAPAVDGVPWRGAAAPVAEADSFPHLTHDGLFPLCTGCHEGIGDGNVSSFYPEPASCDGCHDGAEERRVDWAPPVRPVGLMDFSHPTHADTVAAAGEAATPCASCHVAEEGRRLEVVPLEAERCMSCHEEEPGAHFERRDCASCHRTLAAVPAGDVLRDALPTPDDHAVGEDAFLFDHGFTGVDDDARCATCHTQDRCLSCHVSGDRGEIRALPTAPPGWRPLEAEARYPIPDGHTSDVFEVTHGRPAPQAADCSTCHTQNDCASCHLEPLPTSAASLPERPQVRAPGVGLDAQRPRSHETPFFMTAHTVLASAAPDACSTCHTQTYCADCHDAQRAPGYHPQGFALRHAAAAGAQTMECSTCHNTAAFCLECHVEMGFGSSGRLGPGYHDAEPLWLLRHGQGARQGLEQCASCHTQRDCLQCHSQLGAFKVSPHGPDFDPVQAQERNPWICLACHIRPPLGG